MNEIRFYARDRQRYGWLSNFHLITGGIAVSDFDDIDHLTTRLTWPTTEHYYQAQKFSPIILREAIRSCPKPGDAKRLARLNRNFIRADWDSIKTDVMLRALRAKFGVPYLRKLLLGTGDAVLVEDSPGDFFWGTGHDGTGQNMLGKLLMQVRRELNGTQD